METLLLSKHETFFLSFMLQQWNFQNKNNNNETCKIAFTGCQKQRFPDVYKNISSIFAIVFIGIFEIFVYHTHTQPLMNIEHSKKVRDWEENPQ